MSRWKLVSSLRVKNTWRPSVGGGTSMCGDPRGRPHAARLQQPVRRQLEGFFRKAKWLPDLMSGAGLSRHGAAVSHRGQTEMISMHPLVGHAQHREKIRKDCPRGWMRAGLRKSSPIWHRERKDCPRGCGASSTRCVADAIVMPAVVKQDLLSDRRRVGCDARRDGE